MEEILQTWDTEVHFVAELIAGPGNPRPVLTKVGESMESDDPRFVGFRFALRDANGQNVKFPLQLINDAEFRQKG